MIIPLDRPQKGYPGEAPSLNDAMLYSLRKYITLYIYHGGWNKVALDLQSS
ncbi:MAG: hypothetical protein M3Y25_02585 [Thermoproteota archaeon]|nr:hypothetical protein [Thermoproteota archaeon]